MIIRLRRSALVPVFFVSYALVSAIIVANVVVGGASQGPVYAADGTLIRPGGKDE